ncbi:MAG: (d)CMP kinase, partial [Actinobacteria bacterium]|nr:(d)CMP kinase [Actinomycetota bacterium]
MGIVLAIDGPSGAGKSSTSRAIAKRARWEYLDTGALYRGATWLALKGEITQPTQLIEALKRSPLKFRTDPSDPKLFAGDINITSEIRSQ